ncbi:hypothetical protein GCM10023322_18850 [Rugosimonospora acidiphila]|uniref:DUF3558 domain-containing protein n=1 Tax=Rugosimonospora acidiphila TaxID=556531 RepID=A0ABP9RNC8_9ACTN
MASPGTAPAAGNAAPASAPASAHSTGPIYRKLPACEDFSASTLKSLVPDAQKTTDKHQGDNLSCSWDNYLALNGTNESRAIEINMGFFRDSSETATQAAKDKFGDLLSDAKGQAGTTAAGTKYGAVSSLSGLGTQAFSLDNTTQSDLATDGATTVDLMVDNVIVEIAFGGSDGPMGQEKPMAAIDTSKGAQTAAHAAIDWLTACSDCKS